VQVVHKPTDGSTDVLATDVDRATTTLQRMKGLMGRSSIPESYALVFEFDDTASRTVHMLFVRTPLDVLWLVNERVERVSTLAPWIGLGRADVDTLIELAPGRAEAVTAGDTVRVVEE
jgi:hypothetical protein